MSRGDGGVPEFCRAINERILQYAQADLVSLVCECDRPGCFVNVSVPVREFEAIVATEGVAIVAHGHGDERRRVRRELGYDVVVLRLVASGLSTQEIADQLCYSQRTVKSILHDVTNRFQLRNRSHAVAFAMREGLI